MAVRSDVPPAPHLVGREQELRRVAGLVDGLRDGGAALVVRGAAGLGKSALLAEAERLAVGRGFRILRTTGVESEAQVAFAGLDQLLRPVLGRAPKLAGPQRAAVLGALGQTDAVAPDLFLIALATLNLVAEAATRTPVLVIVEDGHWLDRATADVIAFVARRLEFESIALLVAMRDGYADRLDAADVPGLDLLPLPDDAAAALLDAGFPGLPAAVRKRVLAEAAGNPLALVELPVGLPDDAGTTPWLPISRRLERAFADRAAGLPPAGATLLLVAAANDGNALSETLAAASLLTGSRLTADDLAPTIDAGLVAVSGDRLEFRHPLVRSAFLQSAAAGRRFQAHAALAEILRGESERRAWHRGASTTGPDDGIAAELEVAATHAHRRGGIEAAATGFERAAQLSADPLLRAGRLLRAADLAVELGRRDTVVRLLRQAEPLDLSVAQRAHVAWIRDVFDDGIRDVAVGTRMLAELAESIAVDGDADLAMKVLWAASLRCYFAEPGGDVRARVVAAAERVCPDTDDPRLLAILGFTAPVECGRVILERLPGSMAKVGGDPTAARLVGNAAMSVGAFDLALSLQTTAIAGLRSQGRLALLARATSSLSWCALQIVDLSVAIPSAEEAVRLAEETSQPNIRLLARAHESMIAALRGEHDTTEKIAAEVERGSIPVGVRPALAVIQAARGMSALGDGRYSDAFEHLRRLYDPVDPAFHIAFRCFFVGDVIEAALRCGRQAETGELMAEMEAAGRRTRSPSLHLNLRYARAILADESDAESLFDTALRADLTRWPFARARLQLGYGEWLRRRRRSSESRAPLRAARETFDALGVLPWGERARLELRASGETSRGRVAAAHEALTPQELQIAQMAAEGLTNREIGQKLYLSHRTVSTHLHRIFPKLRVTSRSGLAAALNHGGKNTAHDGRGGENSAK